MARELEKKKKRMRLGGKRKEYTNPRERLYGKQRKKYAVDVIRPLDGSEVAQR